MQSALLSTLGRPEWWAMGLAAFLVRGGILLVLLPIVSTPTVAGVVGALAPIVEPIALGRPTLEGAVFGAVAVAAVALGLLAAGLAGSWLDLALLREAADDEDLELRWRPARRSAAGALAIRLAAHTPTLLAIGYGFVRVVDVAFEEFTSPTNPGIAIESRVLARVPDVVLVVLVAWLLGETVGALAARRTAAGQRPVTALVVSLRQVASVRGLATLALTSAVLVALFLAFLVAAGRAWEHLRGYLIVGVDATQLWAAVVLLVATWVLGLSIAGAALAWRATAWTAETTID